MECLILVTETNDLTMMARIGIMRALNCHVERVFNPDRKDAHWGKRKLARDGVTRRSEVAGAGLANKLRTGRSIPRLSE
jgi:hypothetical protein